MTQLFRPAADTILRFAFLVGAGTMIGGLTIAGGLWTSDYASGVGVAPAQPVPFSHQHHAGELGIDCRYCHTGVETSASAGLPPTYTCMSCHSQIWTGAGMLGPVRESLARGEPLRWRRVNDLPDYAYFHHGAHVSKGVGCSSCHGDVTSMNLTRKVETLHMSFCLGCHREPEQALRAPGDIWDMRWTPPSDQAQQGALRAQHHGIDAARLDNCSTCHR
ncbi:cytochrome c3 family protein [Marinivivus vitaminiproducens]|uniref:cytochrome c3 family protein n=1 Tax=Marinivivus vitaminiproducens TaxID=3035935 RepID=UPI0027A32BDF|nr:cytochrome c3 family protein [Geminicoccaceae bacterium SCSIO 64248]